MKTILLLLIVPFLTTAFCHTARGDDATGSVTGTIVDDAGDPVADCIVVATPVGEFMHGSIGDVSTDAEGKFTIKEIPAGEFALKANTRDGKRSGVKDITVTAGQASDAGKIKVKAKKPKPK
jgi:hypothetical protein